MNITNINAYTCANTLETLRETGKLGYAVARNLRKLKNELVEYIQARDNLIMKYGKQEENGSYIIPKELIPEYLKEIQEYNDISFEFEPYQISEDVFCSGGLTSDQMYVLEWMVEEE